MARCQLGFAQRPDRARRGGDQASCSCDRIPGGAAGTDVARCQLGFAQQPDQARRGGGSGKLQLLADWGADARRCGLQLMWRDTSPQHFNTTGGEWPGGEAPYNCTPHRAPLP